MTNYMKNIEDLAILGDQSGSRNEKLEIIL